MGSPADMKNSTWKPVAIGNDPAQMFFDAGGNLNMVKRFDRLLKKNRVVYLRLVRRNSKPRQIYFSATFRSFIDLKKLHPDYAGKDRP